MVEETTTYRVVENSVDGLVISAPPRQNLGAPPSVTGRP